VDPDAVQSLIERERERLEGSGALAEGVAAWAALAEEHRRAGRVEAAEALAREALVAAPDALTSWMALCLALLEQGRIAEARDELARGLAGSAAVAEAQERIMAWPAAVAIAGLAEEDESIDEHAADMAELVDDATLLDDEAERFTLDDAPEALASFVDDEDDDACSASDRAADESFPLADEGDATGGDAESVLLDGRGTFATHTVATLLEQQGLADEARRLRARLSDDAVRAAATTGGETSTAMTGASSYVDAADAIADSDVQRAAWRARVVSTLEQWLENLRKGVA
jgi:tetratricopeptide (TPR) repeat protein